MNPQAFFTRLQAFISLKTERIQSFTPRSLREVEGLLRLHLTASEVMTELGFDPYFHFTINLAVDPSTRTVRVNLVPLTVIGLEMLMSSGVHIDESLNKRIRQFQDQQVVNEILQSRRSEAVQPEGVEEPVAVQEEVT